MRTIAHLRRRTNKYGAVFRIGCDLSFAIRKFFRDKGFKYIHTPIITGSDCEGAGEMFKVTATDPEKTINKNGQIDDLQDFFGKPASLTVSGQLSAEMLALALALVLLFLLCFLLAGLSLLRIAEFLQRVGSPLRRSPVGVADLFEPV
ncbi:MAG: hypothetical protein KKA35_01925, partial [Proteobacteria bacterium]|nr:hypothetical protein [Pseudomonadota bacterium]